MAEILLIRLKKLLNQSINQSNSKRSPHLFLPAVVTDDFFNKPQNVQVLHFNTLYIFEIINEHLIFQRFSLFLKIARSDSFRNIRLSNF